MQICEVDNVVLEQLIKEFTEKHGDEALKDVYRFHRKLANKMVAHSFPAAEIYHRLLIKDLQGKYSNMSVREIAAAEKISEGTVYNLLRKACRIKKPIYQYSIKGKLLKKWESATAIEKNLGFTASTVRESCRSNRSTYGYVWKYQELTGAELLKIGGL